jgi:hypothetical protein
MARQLRRQGQPVPGYTRDPGSVWIDQNRFRLPNNEWVAANEAGMVAHNSSMDGLMAELDRKHVDPSDVTIAFNSSDPL